MLGVNRRDSVFVRLNERDPLAGFAALQPLMKVVLGRFFAVVRNYTTRTRSVKVIKYEQKVLAKGRIR